MKNIKLILIPFLAILIFLFLTYYTIFGRALKQNENHISILKNIPKVILTSKVVKIDNQKILSKDSVSFIKQMEDENYIFTEQMGSGYFFKKNDDKYISTSQMYSRYLIIFTYPKIIKQTPSSWELITQGISNCQIKSVMQSHSKQVEAEFKNGSKLSAVEENIDDIINLAIKSQEKCGKIIMATE